MMTKEYREGNLPAEKNDLGSSLEVYRLYTFRAKNFIRELLMALDENTIGWRYIIEEATRFSIRLIHLKKDIGATLSEIALAAFWHVLQIRGVNKFNINKLIKLARERLKRRVLYRRILQILSRVRLMEFNFSAYKEIVNIILTTIPKLINDEFLLMKYKQLSDSNDFFFYYIENVRKMAIRIANKIPRNLISGKSRRVIAAICIYIADKIFSREYRIKPFLSAKVLENHLGVSQFTILRRYKLIYNELISAGVLDV